MAIELDTNRLATSFQATTQDMSTPVTAGKAAAALLGGASLTVTNGGATDLEALVAKLKNESERTKFLMLMTSLSSIGHSLNEAQKAALEEGLALSEKLDELAVLLETYEGDSSKAKADAVILQAKIDSLQKQIEQAVQDGKDHNELVAEQKRVREELDAKNQAIADTEGKIAEVKNEIASVRGRISAIASSIGENSLKTIANELATLIGPEEAESPAEAKKEAEKAAANNPLNAIRESLERIERELTDTIEANRIETV